MPQKQKKATVCLLVAIGLTLVFIWGHSLMPGQSSQNESETIKWLLSLLLGEGAVTAFLLKYIRKVAHFMEFFLLGAEVSGLGRLHKTPVMWLYGLGVAAVDETLQFFSPGRAPGVRDVLLDYSGYLCGFCLIASVFWVYSVFRRSHKK